MNQELIDDISSQLAYHICDQNYEDIEPESLTDIIARKLTEILRG